MVIFKLQRQTKITWFLYSSLKQQRGGDKNTVFVVVELRPIFYSSKIVYSQID